MKELLSQKEIMRELTATEMSGKIPEFKNKIIEELNLSEMDIKFPLSFEGSKFLGPVYFNKSVFHSDVNFNFAVFTRILYLGEARMKGSLNCKGAIIREGANLVGAIIEKDLNFESAKIKGFLGLSEIKVLGNVNLKKILLQDLEDVTGTIKGDIIFRRAKVKNIDLEGGFLEGSLDLQEITIFGQLNLNNLKISETLFLKKGIIAGKIKIEGLRYKERVE